VSLGYSVAWLAPRTLPEQKVLEQHFSVAPPPRFQRESADSFGNTCRYFEIHKAHTELRVESRAIVEREPAPDLALLDEPWEQAKAEVAAAVDPAIWEFIYPTEMTPLAAAYTDFARRAFTPGRPLGAALVAFNSQLHAEFEYLPGATDIDTPLAEVWENRAGVCQDFAHLAISALRGIGLAVAYVSGYLLTTPRAGAEHFVGADASHAWFAVWTRELGWVHLDPTNDTVVGDEHIVLAMGRDYSDTPPLKGICFGGGHHQLSVAVTVHEIRSDGPGAAKPAHPADAAAGRQRTPSADAQRPGRAGRAPRDGD
jgi:transglutaminase-like putative cysteine protease